jgi:alkanesulfonate monooxygenase SsuD/methylene tetrahydromethanopterin reductase-like flavin-dependent oxidoreductase (luciferase family)
MRPERRLSVLFPHMVREPGELLQVAGLVRDSGADRLWMGQSLTVETHQALAYLAGAGHRIPVGLSVALMALRHPYDAAAQARSLAVLTGHPPVVAYGAGEPEFATALNGAPYTRPASAVAEYIRVMGRLLEEDRVDHRGALFHVGRMGLPRLAACGPVPSPVAEIGAGVLRPGMARAAGASADVAVTWLTPPRYVRDTLLPALSAGAASAGRPRPRVATVVHAALDRDGRSALLLAQLGAGGHLRVHHYSDMLRRAGLDVHPSDPVGSARELVEEGVFLYGKPGDVAARIRAHYEAGIDEVVLNPFAVAHVHGMDAALSDVREILAEFT